MLTNVTADEGISNKQTDSKCQNSVSNLRMGMCYNRCRCSCCCLTLSSPQQCASDRPSVQPEAKTSKNWLPKSIQKAFLKKHGMSLYPIGTFLKKALLKFEKSNVWSVALRFKSPYVRGDKKGPLNETCASNVGRSQIHPKVREVNIRSHLWMKPVHCRKMQRTS